MIPRPSRVWAIARRDLAQELKGRRGLLFGAITSLLLLPAAAIRVNLPDPGAGPPVITGWGDIPPELSDTIVERVPAYMGFRRDVDGRLVVRAQTVPDRVRVALDAGVPAVRVEMIGEEPLMPGRTILFALISASVLTGAVSESFGGERARKTLTTLLAAAITREELVLGKWLAWSGYGALAALSAAFVAIVAGRVDAGFWLAPLTVVAGGAVALAMFLTRHASDVVGGATVSLRWIPAAISLTGFVAWYVGADAPLVGAMVPLGGALVAAGDTWAGAGPPLLAAACTLSTSLALLWYTARDLEEPAPPPTSFAVRAREAVVICVGAGLAWWLPVVGPLLWIKGGNAELTEGLSPATGAMAGGLAVALMPLVRAFRAPDPADALGVRPPPPAAWPVAVGLGIVLAWTAAASGLVPLPASDLAVGARIRLTGAVQPAWAGAGALVVTALGQEWLYRGWLQRTVGPWLATALFVAVHLPFDPVRGVIVGGGLAALTAAARGSLWPAITARLVWAIAASAAPGLSPVAAAAGGLLVVAAIATWSRSA